VALVVVQITTAQQKLEVQVHLVKDMLEALAPAVLYLHTAVAEAVVQAQ
jgi:hypothetical protein